MKKLDIKLYLCIILLLGIGSALFGAEKLLYGDKVYIKNIRIKKYATRDGNVLVGHKATSDKSVFTIIKDVENPDASKGEPVKYAGKFYLQTSPAAVVGDSGEEYRIYGMKRKLLGAVPTPLKNKIYEFTILPSTGEKDDKPVYYGEKINLQYKIPTSKSPIKYFRFNVGLSSYKKGTEVFGSDDSKLMTKAQIKETKELAFEKVQGFPATKPTKSAEIEKGEESTMDINKLKEIYPKLEDPISLEEFKVGDEVAALSCDSRHIFLLDSIKEWLKAKKTCPICRAQDVRIAKIYKLK